MTKRLILLFIPFLIAAAPTRLNTYTPGTTIESSKVTENEDAIFNYLQAGVDVYADNTIVNADINSSASIDDTKLNLSTIAQDVTLNGSLTVAGNSTFTGTTIADLGTVTTADINGGTIDGVTIGASSAPTVTNLGVVTTADINGGTLDSVAIGATTPSTIIGTTLQANTSLKLATGATVTGILDEDDMATNSATQLATQQSIKAYSDKVKQYFTTCGTVPGSTTEYWGLGGGEAAFATGQYTTQIPVAGTFSTMYISRTDNTNTLTITLTEDNNDEALTAAITGGNLENSDTSHTVAVDAGDNIAFKVANGAGTNESDVCIIVKFVEN